MMQKKILLPGSDLRVSQFCLGTPQWGSVLTGERLERLFLAYIESGGNFFDTAHCYAFWRGGLGASEASVGELIRKQGRREDMVISTKCGHPDGGSGYPRPDNVLTPEMIAADLGESLSRLQLDSVDLLYVHKDDARVPVAEIVDALQPHVQAGRVRYLAASNWPAARIAAANAYAAKRGLAGFIASQPQWSLAQPNPPAPTRDAWYLTPPEKEWYFSTGFPLVAYTASANGYFSPEPKSAAAAFDNPISQGRRQRAGELATKLGVPTNSIALAYLICHPFPVIPILGTMNVSHLQEAISSADVSLSSSQVRWLETGLE